MARKRQLRYFLMARGRFAEEPRMADKRTTLEEAASASPRKRAAPTIDLTATEVPPVADSETAPAVEDESAGEPPGERSGAPKTSWTRPQININGSALAAGAAGAAIMMLLLLGLWLAGLAPSGTSTVATAVDTKTTNVLNGRIAKIEETITKLPPVDAGVADRMAAADNALKALGLSLTALNRRGDESTANAALAHDRAKAAEKAVAELRSSIQESTKSSVAGISAADLDALQRKIAGLEQSAKTTAPDMPARLALSAVLLRDAALTGVPLIDALAQAKSLGADEKALAPLELFVATGVPTAAVLAQELRALLPAMLKGSGAQAPDGGFLERLQANAGKLVRIRPVDAPPGDDASAVLARLEIEAAHADIAGALSDLGKLPEAVRAPAQAWIKKASDRQAGLAAAHALAVDTARLLGPR
jgi:hypothetical protein